MPPTAATLRRRLALLHPERPAVALHAPSNGARLPGHDAPWAPHSEIEGLGYAASPLGTLAALLGCVGEEEGGDGAGHHRLYLAEPMPGAALPEGAEVAWWEVGDAPPRDLPEGLGAALGPAVESACRGDGAWSPFQRRGATARLAAALGEAAPTAGAAIGARLPGRLWQVRMWALSSVWLNDHVVAKVTLPMWRGEGAITGFLAGIAPGVAADVIATGTLDEAPWFLQRRLPGIMPPDDLHSRERLAHTLAALQGRARAESDALLACGAPLLDPAALAAALPELWSSDELASLDEVERHALPELDGWLRESLAALAALDPRPTLVHGDLQLGNALLGDEGLSLIDWSDAALAFPGVDLCTLIGLGEDPRDPFWRPVVDAYRSGFGLAWGAADDAVLELALDVAPAYHALAYERINLALPAGRRWEVSGVVRYLVRRLLRRFLR
jgi:hypothetical protein